MAEFVWDPRSRCAGVRGTWQALSQLTALQTAPRHLLVPSTGPRTSSQRLPSAGFSVPWESELRAGKRPQLLQRTSRSLPPAQPVAGGGQGDLTRRRALGSSACSPRPAGCRPPLPHPQLTPGPDLCTCCMEEGHQTQGCNMTASLQSRHCQRWETPASPLGNSTASVLLAAPAHLCYSSWSPGCRKEAVQEPGSQGWRAGPNPGEFRASTQPAHPTECGKEKKQTACFRNQELSENQNSPSN